MPGPRLTLAAAMRTNGIDNVRALYDGVDIKAAPSWLQRVWPTGVKAMALPQRIFVNAQTMAKIVAGEAEELLRHEAVHIDQWKRHGRVGFLARYFADYVKGRAGGLSHSAAYRSIPFELEASSRNE